MTPPRIGPAIGATTVVIAHDPIAAPAFSRGNIRSSKEALFDAVVDDLAKSAWQGLDRVLHQEGDEVATVAAFSRDFLTQILATDAKGTWRLVIGESARMPELGRIFYERGQRRVEDILTAYLDRRTVAGALAGDPPRAMARTLIGLCPAYHDLHMLGAVAADPVSIAREAADIARRFLRQYARMPEN